MAEDRELRLRAGRAFARAIGSNAVREEFRRNGFPEGTDVILALESDSVEEVYAKIGGRKPPAIIAIYWPANDVLRFTSVTPAEGPAPSDTQDVVGTATIGMLYDLGQQQERSLRLRLKWSPQVVNAHPFALA